MKSETNSHPVIPDWNIRADKFEATYNDETVTSYPFRCCDRTEGYYTRKDGQACTQEDIKLLYEIKSLGQETKFTLEDGKVKVYGFCDHGD